MKRVRGGPKWEWLIQQPVVGTLARRIETPTYLFDSLKEFEDRHEEVDPHSTFVVPWVRWWPTMEEHVLKLADDSAETEVSLARNPLYQNTVGLPELVVHQVDVPRRLLVQFYDWSSPGSRVFNIRFRRYKEGGDLMIDDCVVSLDRDHPQWSYSPFDYIAHHTEVEGRPRIR